MPVSNVNPGQMINASDVNTHINQTNSNTTSIGTLSTTVSGYNTVPQDAALSSSGGNLHCNSISFSGGSITSIAFFSGSGTSTANYSLSGPPDVIVVGYAGNFGGPPTQPIAWYNGGSGGCNVVAQTGFSWVGLAIKF